MSWNKSISNDEVIQLHELATTFRQWKEHADKGTYAITEDTEEDVRNQIKEDARKLIIEGLDKGAQAWHLIKSLENTYGFGSNNPEYMDADIDDPLIILERKMIYETDDVVEHHINLFVEELTGQKPWGIIHGYLGLASVLDRWIHELSKITNEISWDDNNAEFRPASEAIELCDGKFTLSKLSKLLKPNGEIRYMRKGRRCRVHIQDFRAYLKSQATSEIADEAIDEFLEGVEERKKAERKKK